MAWLPVIVWAGVIFVSGLVPTTSVVRAISDGHDTLTTTVAHFVVYAVLGFLLGLALGGWGTNFRRLALALALGVALVLHPLAPWAPWAFRSQIGWETPNWRSTRWRWSTGELPLSSL